MSAASPFAAAWDYRRLGYLGTLPLPARAAEPPPRGFTGGAGVDPSGPDVAEWLDDPRHRGANLAWRLPAWLVAYDVDSHPKGDKIKNGAAEIAAEEARIGALPAGPYSSNRGPDSPSRHRLFRVPDGVYLDENARDEHGAIRLPSVEVIQHRHRYLVAPPSLHRSGRPYVWYLANGAPLHGPPSPELIPDLPAAWLETYGAARAVAASVTSAEIAGLLAGLEPGPPCVVTRNALTTWRERLSATSAARQPTALRGVLALLRHGERGHLGVPDALVLQG